MTIEREAHALRQQFERVGEGAPLGVAWRAASDHLAGLIASAAGTIGHAEELCDTVAHDLKNAIRRNWREEARRA
jgi:hypothetical protein